MTRDEIVKQFDFACSQVCDLIPELRPHKAELVGFAKHHERREVCLTNVIEQVDIFERNNLAGSGKRWQPGRKKHGNEQNRKRRSLVIAAAAQMFMVAIKTQRDQSTLSNAQKSVLQNKDNMQNELSRILKEVPRYDMKGAGTEVSRHGEDRT